MSRRIRWGGQIAKALAHSVNGEFHYHPGLPEAIDVITLACSQHGSALRNLLGPL